jgi:hypothetical protein
MKELTFAFFEDLYKVDNEVNPYEVFSLVESRVSQEMNEELTKDFSDMEIADALFQMGPPKVPGSDGFPARFYQKHCGIVRNDVVAATQKFFLDGVMPEGINDTSIVFIPKGSELEELIDFRPISLCNMIYMLISMCIVNRGIDFRPISLCNVIYMLISKCIVNR